MIARVLQTFSLCLALNVSGIAAEVKTPTPLAVGNVCNVVLEDVDQQQLRLTDGHVTVVTVTTRRDQEKARAVGDRMPTELLADPRFRVVTVINFQAQISRPFHGLVKTVIRSRLEQEGNQLQTVYKQQNILRSARKDLLVVADFNGEAAMQLGLPAETEAFGVFVFDGRGRLLAKWNDVPSAGALEEVLRRGR